MVDLKKGIYSKKFDYVDNDGITQSILLHPLKGDMFKDLWGVIGELSSVKYDDSLSEEEKNKVFMEQMKPEILKKLHDACVITLKNEFKDENEDVIDGFVTSHFFELFPEVIDLNFNFKK